MSQRAVNRIEERTGVSAVSKKYILNDIKRVAFESDADYEAIAEAAASVDADIGSKVLVWICGISDEDHPIVAIQWFETVDPSEVDTSGIDRGDYGGNSNGIAGKQTYTTRPNE
jgi:hypothetical protein